jgi:hypothetical protein
MLKIWKVLSKSVEQRTIIEVSLGRVRQNTEFIGREKIKDNQYVFLKNIVHNVLVVCSGAEHNLCTLR